MEARGDLSDAKWEKLSPLLPPQKARVGRPNNDHRTTINGILHILRTGAPWRDLPERYGPGSTVYGRFNRWSASGLWDEILALVHQDADEAGGINWDIHHVDGSVIRAHQHAAGSKRGRLNPKP